MPPSRSLIRSELVDTGMDLVLVGRGLSRWVETGCPSTADPAVLIERGIAALARFERITAELGNNRAA